MKKRAVLIATPGKPRSGADNASVDIVEWKSFLMDFIGGAWDEEEIDTLTNPSRGELQEALGHAAGCDYAIVTFSGHGSLGLFNDEPTTMVLAYPGEPPIPYFELRPRSSRTLLVLDSCRWAPTSFLQKIAERRRILLAEKAVRAAYRDFYDEQIMRTERGTIILYGCGIGQESRDWYSETQPGGLYTLALLNGARQWLSGAASKDVLDVVQAHGLAAADVVSRNPEQHPDIRHGRRLGVFPLAIKL